jgi:hypothetical protein
VPGMGPPPKPAGQRRRTNATLATTKLPAGGRQGAPPDWPLQPDLKLQAQLTRLHEQIDEASLESQGDGQAAKNATRRLLGLRERAEHTDLLLRTSEEQELGLWRELWATPQAVAWERIGWVRDVAQYARWKVRAESGDLEASKEARLWSDRLGLNPQAMLRLRWEVAGDELGQERGERATAAAAKRPARRRLKAVDSA